MASREVIEEYLVKIGYVTDAISQKKTEDGMAGVSKKVFAVGGAVAGLVASVAAATAAFAYGMRKMYYASELSQSSVKNMHAMSFAAEQIGMSGDAMQSAIHGMAQAVRLNPGLQALVESFGIKVSGRDMSDVMTDFVGALKGMPEFAGAQYAAMFGIDPDTYHQMITHMDDLAKHKKDMLSMYEQMGVDPDAAKKTLMDYANALDKIEEKAKLLGQRLMIDLAPAFKNVAQWTDTMLVQLSQFSKAVSEGHGWEEFKKQMSWEGMFGGEESGATAPGKASPEALKSQRMSQLDSLEKAFGLPTGLLSKMWGAESNFGDPNFMKSKAGALGHFQMMPATAKQYGVLDPNNFEQSALGAARYMADLSKRYGGDTAKALAAYNWGMGNVEQKGLGAAPRETQDYVAKISGADARLGTGGNRTTSLVQNNTINVNGAGHPEAVAKSVATETTRQWGNVARNGLGAQRG